MPTFLELCQDLRREPGVSGGTVATVTGNVGLLEKLVKWIAEADIQIQILHEDWNFLWKQYSLNLSGDATGEGIYAPPASFGLWDRKSFFLQYATADSTPLQFVDYRFYRDNLAYAEVDNGDPEYVTMLPSRRLAVWPIPVELPVVIPTTLKVKADYWAAPTRMVNNSDISAIPERFHRAIVLRAKMMYAGYIGNQGLLSLSAAEFNDIFELLSSAESPGQRTMTMEQEQPMVIRAE